MNEHVKGALGILGAAATGTGAVAAWTTWLDFIARIGAGSMAIIAGYYTAKYYHKKIWRLEQKNLKDPDTDV